LTKLTKKVATQKSKNGLRFTLVPKGFIAGRI